MKVQTLKCKKCGDQLYSRHVHDFRWCSCNSVAVDGGRDYFKITFHEPTDYEIVEVDILGVNQVELERDYSTGEDKYGKI
jgi:hypothetical protein